MMISMKPQKKKTIRKDKKMTKQEIIDELERIADSLSDTDNRWGIEGAVDDLNQLKFDIEVNVEECK